MKKIILVASLVASLSLLTACSSASSQSTESVSPNSSSSFSNSSNTTSTVSWEIYTADPDSVFSDRDYETDYSQADSISIAFDGDTVTASDASVAIDGSTVTITEEGTYILSGELADGQVIVEASTEAKVQLVLDDVTISNSESAAIYIKSTDKTFITMAEGSVNTLSSTIVEDADAEDNVDAVIFSKDDLTINGNGTLNIAGTDTNGITSKDELTITSGTFNIDVTNHGLEANDSICIADGEFVISSGKDGLHAANDDDESLGYIYLVDGTYTIDALGDGLDASCFVEIEAGDFDIITGGGSGTVDYSDVHSTNSMQNNFSRSSSSSTTTSEDDTSMKAIKAENNIYIKGGTFSIDSADDALHSDYVMTILDGDFTISTANDAVKAELVLNIDGGSFNMITCYEGLEAQEINVSDGSFIIYGTDDGLNANSSDVASGTVSINISGGDFYIDVENEGDGFDSNGEINISGGTIVISGTTVTTDTPLDSDSTSIITGGTFLATGSASQTTQNFSSSSTQGAILVILESAETGTVTLTDSDDNVIATIEPSKSYQSIHISSPEIKVGETYYLTTENYSETIVMTDYIYSDGISSRSNQSTMRP